MFKDIYLKKCQNVSKAEFDLLFEEYEKVVKKNLRIDRKFNTVIKQSDRQFLRHTRQISKHNKNKKRFDYIIKHGDTSGRKILSKNYDLEEQLENELIKELALVEEIVDTQKEIIYTMSSIVESRSKETANHVKRVAEYSKLFALYSGMNEEESELLKHASPMHDIGKIAIADSILNKPARLTSEEFTIMKTHSTLGYEMLMHSSRPLMKTAAIVAREHHERFDGTGYPRGISGNDIHIYGRITAVADVFDALGSERVYKKAWKDEDVFKYLKDEREKQFDPKLIDIFFDNIDEFLTVRDSFSDY